MSVRLPGCWKCISGALDEIFLVPLKSAPSIAGQRGGKVNVKHAVIGMVQQLVLAVQEQPVVLLCSMQHGFHNAHHVQLTLTLQDMCIACQACPGWLAFGDGASDYAYMCLCKSFHTPRSTSSDLHETALRDRHAKVRRERGPHPLCMVQQALKLGFCDRAAVRIGAVHLAIDDR